MRALLAGTLLVLALAVTGCGGSGGASSPTTTAGGSGEATAPATQVLSDSVAAAEAASSVHMGGDINSGGQQIGLNLSVAKGKGASGTITVDGATVQLILIGRIAYVKAGASALKALLGGKPPTNWVGRWLKVPAYSGPFQPILGFSDPKALFDRLKAGADAALTNSGVTTYQGQSVIALDDGVKNGTLYVAAAGQPYPVALVKTGSDGGSISFSGWNAQVPLIAPAHALDVTRVGR